MICATTHGMSVSLPTTSGILCHQLHIYYSISKFVLRVSTDLPIDLADREVANHLRMKANLTPPVPLCSVTLYEHLPLVELQNNAFTNPSCRHVSFQGILAFYWLILQLRLDLICLDWQVYISRLSLGDTSSTIDKALSNFPFCQKQIPNGAAAHKE